jgi:hypothetical protein
MRGKRARTASSSPPYDRVIWVEKKTARGLKIAAKVSESPQTPKKRKQLAFHSKKRRVEVSPISQPGFGAEISHIPDSPIPIKLKAKPGKVCFTPYLIKTTGGYLNTVST